MDYVYLYGSSVRMGHKVYIIPILLTFTPTATGQGIWQRGKLGRGEDDIHNHNVTLPQVWPSVKDTPRAPRAGELSISKFARGM